MDPRTRVEIFIAEFAAASNEISALLDQPDPIQTRAMAEKICDRFTARVDQLKAENAVADAVAKETAAKEGRPESLEPVQAGIELIEQWRAQASGGDIFDLWRAQVSLLEVTHAVPGALEQERGSFGTPPNFAPNSCQVSDVTVEGSSAVVKVNRQRFVDEFVEFSLIDVDGDWRISDVVEFLDPPEAPLVAEAERGERLASGLELKWRAPLGKNDRADLAALFGSEGTITDDEKVPVSLEVREVGRFPIRGRVLVGDWGYDVDYLAMLNRPVTTDSAVAEIAVVGNDTEGFAGRVVALRVSVSDAEVVSWHRALSGAKGGYAVGVDAGMAGIFDAEGYFALSTRAWTLAWRESAASAVESIVLADADGPVGVASSSGWGDGTYGVYWGCDADGNPAQLVIDYAVLDH